MGSSRVDFADTEYLSFPDFFKATPAEEGGSRFVYLEASNEARDFQGERVLAKALADSAEYYSRYGNLDLDHLTQIGAKKGIPNHYAYEIGRPLEVKVRGEKTWVKGSIYQGDAPVAAHANEYWDSLTKLRPPKRWYPSVGGAVMDKGPEFDPATRTTSTVVRKVRWTNIGFSQTPVNLDVPEVSTVPFGALAKSWGAGGLNLNKALTAGYGTDSATLSGGGALRRQSLDRGMASYWDFRDAAARDLRKKRTKGGAADLVEHAHRTYGLEKSPRCRVGRAVPRRPPGRPPPHQSEDPHMNEFEALLAELAPLAKAMDAPEEGDAKVKAAAAEAGATMPSADTDAGAAGGEGAGAGEEDGDEELLGKSFSVTLADGSVQEAFDGTLALKALSTRMAELRTHGEGLAAELTATAGDLAKALQVSAGLMGVVKQQGELIKSMRADITAIGSTGRGRQATVTLVDKPGPTGAAPAAATTVDDLLGQEHDAVRGRDFHEPRCGSRRNLPRPRAAAPRRPRNPPVSLIGPRTPLGPEPTRFDPRNTDHGRSRQHPTERQRRGRSPRARWR